MLVHFGDVLFHEFVGYASEGTGCGGNRAGETERGVHHFDLRTTGRRMNDVLVIDVRSVLRGEPHEPVPVPIVHKGSTVVFIQEVALAGTGQETFATGFTDEDLQGSVENKTDVVKEGVGHYIFRSWFKVDALYGEVQFLIDVEKVN